MSELKSLKSWALIPEVPKSVDEFKRLVGRATSHYIFASIFVGMICALISAGYYRVFFAIYFLLHLSAAVAVKHVMRTFDRRPFYALNFIEIVFYLLLASSIAIVMFILVSVDAPKLALVICIAVNVVPVLLLVHFVRTTISNIKAIVRAEPAAEFGQA
jgi:hypothetical protein